MNKINFFLVGVIALSYLIAEPALAHTPLPDAGTLPTSHWYVLKTFSEETSLFFTGSPLKKAEKLTHFAEVRLAEANSLIDANEALLAVNSVKEYRARLGRAFHEAQKAEQKKLPTDQILIGIANLALKRQTVVAYVYEFAPATKRPSIQEVMDFNMQMYDDTRALISTHDHGSEQFTASVYHDYAQSDYELLFDIQRKKDIPIPKIPN